ncbi:MAG: nitroreductase family protein [Desulfuromonadales bacterium]|nr:nitroreductase family protein [Desulfuromonadales bacterium]
MLALLRKRRSIRQFTNQTVEAEKIDRLIEAAVRTPTSRGRNPWEFIVVTEPELLAQLGCAKESGSAFLAGAPLAIVVAADATKSDVWTEDCSIAAIVIQLAAEELGLGSCWAQIRLRPHSADCSAEQYLKELLGLPASYVVECVLGIGYPAEEKAGHATEVLPFSQVHRNKF